jgi:N-acetylmuramoyl-L-alanine amidase
VAEWLGFERPREAAGRITLQRPYAALQMDPATRRLDFNGLSVYLNAAPRNVRGTWYVAQADADGALRALAAPDCPLSAVGVGLVLLDPGHGGADPGARYGANLEEKRLTLDVARRARAKLREMGVRVELTRDRDRFLSLEDRAARARALRADLFVSIHFNAATDTRTGGIETFVVPAPGFPATTQAAGGRVDDSPFPCNRFEAANVYLASCLQRGLVAHGRSEDRGVKRARFYVIKQAPCPAALVECGFLSNRREAARILEESHRDRLAEGITRGVLTYLWRVREARYARNGAP